jgi:hypothetical protein
MPVLYRIYTKTAGTVPPGVASADSVVAKYLFILLFGGRPFEVAMRPLPAPSGRQAVTAR